MTDAAAMLSYVSALMEFEAGGVPVHMLINILLALIVTFRVLRATFKGTAAATSSRMPSSSAPPRSR